MRLKFLSFMFLVMATPTLAQARPAEVVGVKEWDLVVERTVSVSNRAETNGAGANLFDERNENIHCTFQIRLVTEFVDEAGAEWAGKGRGNGTATRTRRGGGSAAGFSDESLDQRDASGAYDAEATLQIDLEKRRYRFDVQGGEGMKGTMVTRKRGKERSSAHTETCSAGVTEQPLPERGTILSGTVTKETPLSGSTGGVRSLGAQRVTTTWTLKPRGRVMARLFIEPGPGYATWLPEGSDSPLGLGSSQLVRLVLEGENGGPATVVPTRVRVRLVEVSREKGISLNWPRNGGTEPDLFFRRERMDNVREVRNAGQEAILEGGTTQWTLPVFSNDYGAFGKLMAEAELPGGVIVSGEVRGAPSLDRLALPKDDNGNRIADAWERAVGARSTDPESDTDDTRPGMVMKGDGLTLYEEYRGLRTVDAPHRRLDPNRPDFFFIDDARLVDVVQWESITGFAAHRLEWPHMRLGGVVSPQDKARSAELRHVDHNEGHAKGRQAHAVWVHANFDSGDDMLLIDPTQVNENRLGGTIALDGATQWAPKTTVAVFVNIGRLTQFATANLEAELRSRATGPDRNSTNHKWDVTPQQAQALADRLKAEARAVAANMPAYLAKAVLHELSHSVGLDEHEPHPNLGAQSCLINYPPHGALALRLLGGFPPQTLCSADTCRPRLRLLPP